MGAHKNILDGQVKSAYKFADKMSKKIDPFKKQILIGFNEPATREWREKLFDNARLGRKTRIIIPKAEFISSIFLDMDFNAAVGALPRIQTATMAGAGTAYAGNFYVIIDEVEDDIDNKSHTNIAGPFTQATTDAALETAINALDIIAKHGLLDVTSAGTYAAFDKVLTFTYRINGGERPIVRILSSMTETTSGIGDTWVNVTSQAGCNYNHYLALLSIQRVRLIHQSHTLYEIDYQEYMLEYLNRLPEEQRKQILNAAGGYIIDSNTPQVSAWIPMPWDLYNHGNSYCKKYMPYSVALDGQLELEIDLQDANTVTDDGATCTGDLASVSILVDCNWKSKHEELKMDYDFFINDVQTNVTNLVATATRTQLNLTSFEGTLKDICFALVLVSDYDANDKFNLQEIDRIEVYINSSLYWEQTNEKRSILQSFADNEYDNEKHGKIYRVPFQLEKADSVIKWSGGLNLDSKINTLNVYVTHSVGANCYLQIVSNTFAKYHFNAQGNKNIERIR